MWHEGLNSTEILVPLFLARNRKPEGNRVSPAEELASLPGGAVGQGGLWKEAAPLTPLALVEMLKLASMDRLGMGTH